MKNKFQLIPIAVLAIMEIVLLVTVITSEVAMTQGHYIGLALLGLTLIAYLVNNKAGSILTGVTLLLGTLRIVAFTPTIYYFGLAGKDFIDLCCFPLFLGYALLFRSEIIDWIMD